MSQNDELVLKFKSARVIFCCESALCVSLIGLQTYLREPMQPSTRLVKSRSSSLESQPVTRNSIKPKVR